MYRRSFVFLFTTHSVRAVPFQIAPTQAEQNIKAKYNSRWFGPSTEYIEFKKSTAEYLPFFLCQGEMRGTYTAAVRYTTRTTDSNGKSSTSTRTVYTNPQSYLSSFQPNVAQIYAGYKFSNRQVMKVIADPEAPLVMKKIHEVDIKNANLNLFEMSTTTLGVTAKSTAMRFADEEARKYVEGFHNGADSIEISWQNFEIDLEDVFPCYLPAIVSEIMYDNESFTIYSNGRTGNSTGPYLLSGVALGRAAVVGTFASSLLLVPNKIMAVLYGSIACVPLYYAAYYFGKKYPVYIRDRNRREREKRQQAQAEADREGFRPDVESKRRVFGEKQSSQEKNARYDVKKSQTGRVRDVSGYYRILGVNTDASINDIRQAYRQKAITNHPDAGGDSEKMTSINEAYRILRDPVQREAYDKK